MKARIVDEAISQAWLDAAKDLGIRVTAPFTIQTGGDEVVTYEADVPDFGGPKGSVTGVLNDKLRDCRTTQDYYLLQSQPLVPPLQSTIVYRHTERLGLVWADGASTRLVYGKPGR